MFKICSVAEVEAMAELTNFAHKQGVLHPLQTKIVKFYNILA